MKQFNAEQIEYMNENHYDMITDQVNLYVDNALMFYRDVEDYVREFSNIVDVLNGNYTMSDLYSDVYELIYADELDNILDDVYNELDHEEQQKIDELDD